MTDPPTTQLVGPAAGPPSSAAGRLRTALTRSEPLLRNGHVLTVSSLLASVIGAGYWALAAHWYTAGTLGRSYSAVSAMMFLGGLGQLNLANTMVRFVAPAGRRTRWLVSRSYLAAGAAGLLLGIGFVLLVPQIAPGLAFLHAPVIGFCYAAAVGGYAIFVLQDGVLTGLRRPNWVVLENALFAMVKVGLLWMFAAIGWVTGILASWMVGLVFAIAFTNTFLFARALPRHERELPEERTDCDSPTLGYLLADYAGALCWLAATTLPPILVLDRLGAAPSAYFGVAWLVAYALYQFAINMCASLTVEAGDDPRRLGRHLRRMLRHASTLLTAAVAVTVVGAPWLMKVFGADYASHATGVLRVLALSALPNLLVSTVVAVCRVRRRMKVVVGTLAALAVLLLGLTELLLPRMGIMGAAVAWLVAQSVVAGVLLGRRSWWLPEPGPTAQAAPPASSIVTSLRGLLPIRRPTLVSLPGDLRAAHRLRPALAPEAALHRATQGKSDVLVLRTDRRPGPALAVKLPRNAQAARVLAHEWAVLRELSADERLGDWRRLLPSAVSCRPDGPTPVITEGWLPGAGADGLLRRRPEDASGVTRLSLAAIAELHRATGRLETADGRVDDWLTPRLASLASLAEQVPWCRVDGGAAGLDAVRRRLSEGLAGRTMNVAWTHGDYAPGNVLLDADRTRVTGVVDWGGALADGPAAVDACTFVIALRAELSGRAIGGLVAEIVRTGGLAPEDRLLLATAGPARPDDGRDPVVLPLLTWLWHVANNLDKSPRYGRSRWWVTANVVPVLREAARWTGL